ncbi:MAG TPA: hypothetical protein VHC72_15785 [Bryobacteraceae bacterium]|nr:hypothetical protein [Bryobacteraceae bacterium]
MANVILRGLAIAAGTGLAMGLTSGRTRTISRPRAVRYRPAVALPPPPPDPLPLTARDEVLDIEPLLERVERLEDLVDGMKRSPAPAPADFAAAVANLERRIDEQTRDLELLRQQVEKAERRAMESVAAVQRDVEQTRAEIPEIVERTVAARTEDLRSRFSVEIEQSRERMLQVFERAIDERISSRIGAIERTLAEQAGSIEALNTRAAETDHNLQRLVSAIEKLCERSQLIPPVAEPAPVPPPAPRAFESQLQDAMRRDKPAMEVPAPAFAAAEERPKKSRFLFRNLIVAGLAVLASRFLR